MDPYIAILDDERVCLACRRGLPGCACPEPQEDPALESLAATCPPELEEEDA